MDDMDKLQELGVLMTLGEMDAACRQAKGSPDQARDDHGRWSSDGGSGGASRTYESLSAHHGAEATPDEMAKIAKDAGIKGRLMASRLEGDNYHSLDVTKHSANEVADKLKAVGFKQFAKSDINDVRVYTNGTHNIVHTSRVGGEKSHLTAYKAGTEKYSNPRFPNRQASQVQDDLGRFGGDHPSGTYDGGGAGVAPLSAAECAQRLADLGVPSVHQSMAMGRDEPAHFTSMNHPDVHAKIVAGMFRHVARAGHATPVTEAAGVEQNAYDHPDGTRLVTEHVSNQAGTAVRGYKKRD